MAGDKIIAIGDIHGEHIVLCEMLNQLDRDHNLKRVRLLFQELTDRGVDSQYTIKLIRDFKRKYPQTIIIQSNHDEMNSRGELYGLEEVESAALDYESGEMSLEDRAFLAGFPLFFESNKFIFIHGGLSPGVNHPSQDTSEALLWNMGTSLRYQGEKRIVMGHSVKDEIIDNPKTIYIDTGATFSFPGKLSAVVLNDATGECEQMYSIKNISLFDHELRKTVQARRYSVFNEIHKNSIALG